MSDFANPKKLGHGHSKLRQGHRTHMRARHFSVACMRHRLCKLSRRAIVAIVDAAQHQRRHFDMPDYLKRCVDKRIEYEPQGFRIATDSLEERPRP